MVMEWFSRTLNGAVEDGYIHPYKTKRGSITVNHLLFADDMLIFTNGAKDSIRNLISLVEDFGVYSGQRLNASKSVIIFSKHFTQRRKTALLEMTGFMESGFPITYLGVPLFRGHIKLEYFQPLEQRLMDKIKGWSKKFLSMGGRVTLVNSVLISMGIHNMMVLPIPVKTLDRITSMLAGFVWDTGEAKRHHWVSWDRITLSKELGGLGIKKPGDMQSALHGKLAWRFLQRQTLWARFAHTRFKENESGSVVWNSFRHMLDNIREATCWDVGDGSMSMGDMCDRLKWHCPDDVTDRRVEGLIQTPLWRDLVEEFPWPVRDHMLRCKLENNPAKLRWMKSQDGEFSTRVFWESFQTKGITKPWVKRVWNAYIPPKIACFVWKVIYNAVPTDENVTRLGICITSKCVCCSNPDQESLEHLLFTGGWATKLWQHLAGLFVKPMVRGVEEMLQVWFSDTADDFVSHLGSLMAAFGLWEIWKARNTYLHENRRVDWMRRILYGVASYAFLIRNPFRDDYANRQLLQVLRIRTP